MKKIAIVLLVGLFTFTSGSAQAKLIGFKRAKQIVMRLVKGKIKSSELEKEKGQLVYSFDVRNSKGGITEVLVNAYSGKVIEVKNETAADEAKEKAEDAKKKQ
jgi:uncharacterized membrane protein YkoI